MAKEKEKNSARIFYTEHGKTAKWIANTLNVTEKTVGNWIAKYKWKELRNANENSVEQQVENIKEIINEIVEDRRTARLHLNTLKPLLKIAKDNGDTDEIQSIKDQISDLRRDIVSCDDGASKWNKTLENLDKNNKVSLSTYIQVMEDIFKDLQNYDPKLYSQSLDFQEQHINKVSISKG